MRFSLKIIYLLAALFLGIAVVACSDDAAEAIPTLEIAHSNGEQLSGTTINFEQEGGTLEIAIKSNTAWSIGSTVPWITLSEENGSGNGMVTIEVEPTDQPRSAVVVIQVLSSNALRHTFNVVQTASQTTLRINPPTEMIRRTLTIVFLCCQRIRPTMGMMGMMGMMIMEMAASTAQ